MFIRSLFLAVVKRRIRLMPVRAGRLALLATLSLLALPAVAQAAPTAWFTAPSSAPINTAVTFDASGSTGTIKEYVWNFGDGSQTQPTNSATVPYTFTRGGIYNVTLTVVDGTGAIDQVTHQISISAPPTAAFNPTVATVLAGSPVSFDGTQSTDPLGSSLSYSWNFGDGATSTGPQPSHSYTAPGTYNATLIVTDNSGSTGTVTHQITVIAPPPIQTLLESILPAPILVKFTPPFIPRAQLVDLGERLFCPGSGPVCQTTIAETSTGLARDRRHRKPAAPAKAAARTVLITPANGNAELALHLTSRQWAALRTNRRLRLALSIVSTRGAEKTTSLLRLKLSYPPKKKKG